MLTAKFIFFFLYINVFFIQCFSANFNRVLFSEWLLALLIFISGLSSFLLFTYRAVENRCLVNRFFATQQVFLCYFLLFFLIFTEFDTRLHIYTGWDFWKIMGGCSSFSCKTRGNPCTGDCLQKWWLALLFISNLWIFSINALYSVQQVFHANIYFSFNSFWITETDIFSNQILVWC